MMKSHSENLTPLENALLWFEKEGYELKETIQGKMVKVELLHHKKVVKATELSYSTEYPKLIQSKIIAIFEHFIRLSIKIDLETDKILSTKKNKTAFVEKSVKFYDDFLQVKIKAAEESNNGR